jgi:hypothetical protein
MYPLDLGRSLIYPGRRLIGVVGKIKTKSDVLAWLLSDLESHGIKLRHDIHVECRKYRAI